ncbi:MAG: proton-conducting transporter transmembrane domain-containing protein, partial [Rhizomicrobium sp.]
MYQAIVFLPLVGFLIAGLISLVGAHARFPGARAVDLGPDAHHDAHDAVSHVHAASGGGHDDGHGSVEPPAQGSRMAEAVTTTFLFIAMALSWVAFIQVGFFQQDAHVTLAPFIPVGDLKIDWALRIDTLTAVMLVVVTTVSALVHLYSVGYMSDDPYRPRFFAYLSLFTFAMLMLVTADNLVQLFFGWEGVGLASYLLIGFWYYKPDANAAAIKAFVVNRVGDFGFALGIFA